MFYESHGLKWLYPILPRLPPICGVLPGKGKTPSHSPFLAVLSTPPVVNNS